jgi:hypothetical protein
MESIHMSCESIIPSSMDVEQGVEDVALHEPSGYQSGGFLSATREKEAGKNYNRGKRVTVPKATIRVENEKRSSDTDLILKRFDEIDRRFSSLERSQRQFQVVPETQRKQSLQDLLDQQSNVNVPGSAIKGKANRDQYEFNVEVRSLLAHALQFWGEGGSFVSDEDVQEMHATLIAADRKMAERQKHIRIADTHDWGVVQAYKADPVAEGSDDEKRLKKAVKTADATKKDVALVRRKVTGQGMYE